MEMALATVVKHQTRKVTIQQHQTFLRRGTQVLWSLLQKKTKLSYDATSPIAARAGISIGKLPFVQKSDGSCLAPLPPNARLEEYVEQEILDNVTSNKPSAFQVLAYGCNRPRLCRQQKERS